MSMFSFKLVRGRQEYSTHEISKLLVSIVFFQASPPRIMSSFSELNLSAFFLDRFPSHR